MCKVVNCQNLKIPKYDLSISLFQNLQKYRASPTTFEKIANEKTQTIKIDYREIVK